MTTIRDVAKHANVSIATVSRVMNGANRVSAQTVALIEASAKELGYDLFANRRGSEKQKVKQLLFAIILPSLSNPYFAELLEVIESELRHENARLILHISHYDRYEESRFIESCKQLKIDGLFVVPTFVQDKAYLAEFKSLPFKVVSLTQLHDGLPSVAIDHEEGGALVAEHLVSMGHQKIGYIGTLDDIKFIGFAERLKQLGITENNLVILENHETTQYAISSTLLSAYQQSNKFDFTALFATNDVAAQFTINYLETLGIGVPENMLVVGFDNTLIAQVMNISSVSQPIREIGNLACEEMQRLLNESHYSQRHIVLRPRLVLRESSLLLSE